ncbi:LysR family transcriptional regulator [Falsigemmobacter faecalis]|uniref:LysR family transcriptional regulator n=1 Tax=Falsigemmobacter faecalis TaxID=2488730 RepID=UPI0018F38C43|nr:LysR family transcriptional regulator [Falsigemmobacter faecalis]
MNLRQLEVLRAVVQYGTTTAAAEWLGMSQPSISNTVRHVETLLGLKLFDRVSNRLVPTQEALTLMEDCTALFQLRDAVNQKAADLKAGRIGQIYITATAELSEALLPRVMAAYKTEHARVKLTLETNRIENVLTSVESGLADIGFMYSGYQRKGVVMEPLATIPAVCLCRHDHPLAGYDEITPADLEGVDLVGPQTENRAGLQIATAFRIAGHEYKPEVEVRFMNSAAQMVRSGWGVTITDALTARNALTPDLVIRPFAPQVDFLLTCVTASHKQIPRHLRRFIQQCRGVLSG